MSAIEQLKSANLFGEFETQLSKFVVNDDPAVKAQIIATIEKEGLQGRPTMKLIGDYQKVQKLTPGLYKEFLILQRKLVPVEQAPAEAAVAVAPKDGEQVSQTPQVEEVASVEDFTPTAKQEAVIQAKMAKEKERMHKRLLDRERKIRLRLAERANKRAARIGTKVEENQEIVALKERMQTIREDIKAKRLELKECRDKIQDLRPKRQKKSKKEKEEKGEKEAAPAVDPTVIAAQTEAPVETVQPTA